MACDQIRTREEYARCQCGHGVTSHVLTDGKRRACSHMDEKGQCPCPSPR